MALWDVTLCRRIRFHSVRGRAVSLESKVSDPRSGAGGAFRMGNRRTVSDVDDISDLGCNGIYRGTAVSSPFFVLGWIPMICGALGWIPMACGAWWFRPFLQNTQNLQI